MESLFLFFLFLFTLTSAQSVDNDNLNNSSPNVAPSMQPAAASSSSSKQNANSPTSYFPYPPGYENDNSRSQSEFSSISIDSISSSDQLGASGLVSSLTSTNKRKDEGASSDHDKIKEICDNTDYPDLCTETIFPLMRGNAINVQNVLQVAMKASDQFAKLAFATFKRASESPATPPKTKTMLKTCLDSWDTVAYNYKQAIQALHIHDSGRMSTMLSAAITDISDCEDAFEDVVSPMNAYGERMTKMTSNCLAIVSQLDN